VNDAGIGIEGPTLSFAGFGEQARRTTNAIAAHLGFAAIRVDRAHADVGDRRSLQDDAAIGTDACAAIASPACKGSDVIQGRNARVNDDEIVARAVHLGDVHHSRFADQPSFSLAKLLTRSGGSQRVAGSLRNHARCRRAYRRVARSSAPLSSRIVLQPRRYAHA